MTTTTIMNEDEWPSLTSANDDNEWELLNSSASKQPSPDDDTTFELVVAPTMLRHCNSSPNFKTLPSNTNSTLCDNGNLASVAEDTNHISSSDSFTLVSNPTTSMNFRRAIGSTPTTTTPPTSPLPTTPSNNKATPSSIRSPRFVVVPVLRRCSKSTGDLLQHAAPLDDDDHQWQHDDHYRHHKAMGATSFTAGRKLRPDEAKRKEYSVRKKQLQRRQQQQKG